MSAPMTTTSCPDEEMLAALIDGRLDSSGRRRVFEHMADCAECRDVVTTARELRAAEIDLVTDVPPPPQRARWVMPLVAIAAAAVLGFLFIAPLRDGWLRPIGMSAVEEATADLEYRRVEARLSGNFEHKPLPDVTRSAEPTIPTDGSDYKLLDVAGRIQNSETRTAASLHALGVSHLLLGYNDTAIQALERASTIATDADLRYAASIDLAAALLERGRWKDDKRDIRRARSLSMQLWAQKQTPQAAWNRALAAERLGARDEAMRAWDDFLRLDSQSAWAAEARKKRAAL